MTREEMDSMIETLDRISDSLSGDRYRLILALRDAFVDMQLGGRTGYLPGEKLLRMAKESARAFEKDDGGLAAVRHARTMLFAPCRTGGPGEKAGSREMREYADFLADCLKAFRTVRMTAEKTGERTGEDRQEENACWEAEQHLLEEKLQQVLLVYEMAGHAEIRSRILNRMEELQALSADMQDLQRIQDETERLEEEQRIYMEKTAELKKRWETEETFDQAHGYTECIDQKIRKEDQHEPVQSEKQKRIPQAESAD